VAVLRVRNHWEGAVLKNSGVLALLAKLFRASLGPPSVGERTETADVLSYGQFCSGHRLGTGKHHGHSRRNPLLVPSGLHLPIGQSNPPSETIGRAVFKRIPRRFVCQGMLGVVGVKRLGPPNSVGLNQGLLKARLEPSRGPSQHITFQTNSVRLSSHRLQIEEDGQRGLWEGFPLGIIPATSVKRIPFANPTSRPRLLVAPLAALHLHVLRPLAAAATGRFP